MHAFSRYFLKGTYYAGLGCPQNVSEVSAQNTPQIIYYIIIQMLGENEDAYVQFFIQTQNTGIAYETLLTLQLLEHRENAGQRTTKHKLAEGGNYSNAGLSVSGRG